MPNSVYQDIRISGSIDDIIRAWEGKAYSEKDESLREIYFQHAHHWRKMNEKAEEKAIKHRRIVYKPKKIATHNPAEAPEIHSAKL